MSDTSRSDPEIEARRVMAEAGLPDEAVDAFALHLGRFLAGETGTLEERRIEPVDRLPDLEDIETPARPSAEPLARTVVIKLNGGLGTGMGLERAKSLIEVRPGLSFLDLIARQVLDLRERRGLDIPLLLMNSFRTADDTGVALGRFPDLAIGGLPLGFIQHKVPKIDPDTGLPVRWPADPEHEWCPPGHGDLYTALAASGTLQRLLEADFEHAFVSNSDNLGAVLDPRPLEFMTDGGFDFVMEVADRTAADRKGGHLCRLADGRFALRESAQCPPDETHLFRDTERHRFFNTNNIWLSLSALAELLDRHGGFLPLDTIFNSKPVDPRDPGSHEVVQLESAMGAAISLFDRAAAIRVPRRRFSPVKTTDDLLAVRSDAYELTDDGRIVLRDDRSSPPTVELDPAYFKLLDEFDRRFPAGPPSLAGCTGLAVRGDVTFGARVVIEGEVEIRGGDEPSRIPDGAVLRGEHRA